jgi:methionyl-tRNA synthetase
VVEFAGQKPKRILVLCALPYTNAIPHIGNIVGSHLPADIFARYCRLKGDEIVFIGGADENGTPTEIAALELKITPKELTDVLYKIHKQIYEWFEISYDNFSRTSLPIHHQTTQEFFKKLYDNGFISEGTLKLPYCEKDQLFLPDRYVEGTCPNCGYPNARGDQCDKCTTLLDPDQIINPKCKICGSTPIIKESKHLFLEFNKLEPKIEKWIRSNRMWREQVTSLALGWIKEGLKKRCITRDLKWGVPVPLKGYEDKVFYVWFDAPIGYLSFTKEWSEKIGKPDEWKKYWQDKDARIYNFLGKDNIPFHTIFWPGMIIAHGELNLPYDVVGLQYCNYEGDKISKSRNWGIFCEKVVQVGLEADIWRYYFTYLIPEVRDTEFRWEDFENRINGELVANIGNFIYRTLSFIWNNFDGVIEKGELKNGDKKLLKDIESSAEKIEELLDEVRLRDALVEILRISSEGNKYFQENKPWELVETDKERCKSVLYVCANLCKALGVLLSPYLPKASKEIFRQLNVEKEISWSDVAVELPAKHKINEPRILFEKLTKERLEKLKVETTKTTPLIEFFKK